MSISSKDLVNLPVYTVSSHYLGRVSSFEIDAESQLVVRYYVRMGSLSARLLKESRELIVANSQVVSLTEEKMVIDDLVAKDFLELKQEMLKNKEAVATLSSETS